jgi:ubiquinone/menaquinone biosynthesis C-methylase UbiE
MLGRVTNTRTRESAAFLAEPGIHEQWESAYLNQDLDRFYERAFGLVSDRLAAGHAGSILDAGCGYCIHAARLARHGFRVTGVDFSVSALTAASEYLKRQGLEDSITLKQGDLLALPFADGQVEGVTCWGVLMHIFELETALLELARVLAPGGRLVIMENNAASLHVQLWEPTLRVVKRCLGHKLTEMQRTPRGIEEWRQGDGGGLLVRKTDIDWLVAFLGRHHVHLVERCAGQFTELYTSLHFNALKRLVCRLNEAWFDHGGSARLALGNILVFEKHG